MKSSLIKCKLCGEEYKLGVPFTCHIKNKHGFKLGDYFQSYEPRRDIHTGDILPFKNVDQYFKDLFSSKKTEFAYLKANDGKEKAQEILQAQLLDIFQKKNDKEFPSYIEWRSSKNIRYDWLSDETIENLKKFWKSLGGKVSNDRIIEIENTPIKEGRILIDTREQLPFFEGERTTINVGDYTFEPSFYTMIHVDRKSHDDFIGTFTKGLSRFEKEMEKAIAMNVYLVVLVESNFSESFNALPKKYLGAKVGGQNAFHGVRSLLRKYPDNLQFLFCDGREHAKTILPKILSLDINNIKNIDLQFSIEKNKI